MEYCNCFKVQNVGDAWADVIDEIKEFIDEPSKDEGSDIAYGINRMVGGMFNKEYVRILPFDKLHIAKMNTRMEDYGCIRSKRHLRNGKCPSA